MAAVTKTPSNTWKAVVRKRGWPVTIKTFRAKRDAADWARSTEDEMARGVHINRAGAERLLFDKALDRYLAEVSASKRQSTAYGESRKAKALKKKFDAYSLAAITPDLVAECRVVLTRDEKTRRRVLEREAIMQSDAAAFALSACEATAAEAPM